MAEWGLSQVGSSRLGPSWNTSKRTLWRRWRAESSLYAHFRQFEKTAGKVVHGGMSHFENKEDFKRFLKVGLERMKNDLQNALQQTSDIRVKTYVPHRNASGRQTGYILIKTAKRDWCDILIIY